MCNTCDRSRWEELVRSACNSMELQGYHHAPPIPDAVDAPRGVALDGFYTAGDLRKIVTALENAHA